MTEDKLRNMTFDQFHALRMSGKYPCDRQHRGPQGPNEDIAMCGACMMPTFSMRPKGETFGLHADDCSLPADHQSYCKPGGTGHEPAANIRG